MRRFYEHGQVVTLEGVDLDGRLSFIGPARVVEDSEHRAALYVCEGTPIRGWNPVIDRILNPNLPINLEPKKWERTDFVSIHYPGNMYSIWPMWKMPGRKFRSWYVNIELPFKRTAEGFQLTDLELDVVVRPDLTWYWKDEEEFDRLTELGYFSEDLAAKIRQAGNDAIASLQANMEPFNEPWPSWRPDPNWGVPAAIEVDL